MDNQQQTMTSGQIARLLGISPRTARRYLMLGKIHAEQHPLTGRWRVTRASLHSFLAEHGLEGSLLGGNGNGSGSGGGGNGAGGNGSDRRAKGVAADVDDGSGT